MKELPKNHASLIAKIDQAGAFLAEGMPPVLWGYYSALLVCGFNAEQAFKLAEGLQTVLMLNSKKARE